MLCIKPKKKPFAALATSDGLWDNLRGNVYIRPLADSKATIALKAKHAAAAARQAATPVADGTLAQTDADTDTDASSDSDSDTVATRRGEDGLTAEQRVEQSAQWVYEFETGLLYPMYDRDRVLTATGRLDGAGECAVGLQSRDGYGGGPGQRWLLSLPGGAPLTPGRTDAVFDGTLSLVKYPKKVISLSIRDLAKLEPLDDEDDATVETQQADQVLLLAGGKSGSKPAAQPSSAAEQAAREKEKQEKERKEKETKEKEAKRAERMSRRLSAVVFDRVGGGIAYENELEFELIREERTITGRTLLPLV